MADDDLKKTSWNVKQHTRNLPPETVHRRIMGYIRRAGFRASPSRSDRFGVGDDQHGLNYNPNIGGPTHELAHAYMTPPGETLREHQKKMGNLTTPQSQRAMPQVEHRAEELAAFATEPQIKRRAGVSPSTNANAYDYHARNEPVAYKAAQARGVGELNAIDEGRKVISPKGAVLPGTSVHAKINERAMNKTEEPLKKFAPASLDDEATGTGVAPTPAKTAGQANWLGRAILHPDHASELEQHAAVNEFGLKMPRKEAEQAAYADYEKRQRTEAAAHHLAGMKAAHAAGDMESARKHGMMYQLHVKHLGHEPVGPAASSVAALLGAQKVYRFKPHKGDHFAVQAHQQAKGPVDTAQPAPEPKPTPVTKHEILHALYKTVAPLIKAEDDAGGLGQPARYVTKYNGPAKICHHRKSAVARNSGSCQHNAQHVVWHHAVKKHVCTHHAKAYGAKIPESTEKTELAKGDVLQFPGNPKPPEDKGGEADVQSIKRWALDNPKAKLPPPVQEPAGQARLHRAPRKHQCQSCGYIKHIATNHTLGAMDRCDDCSWKGMKNSRTNSYDGPGLRSFAYVGDKPDEPTQKAELSATDKPKPRPCVCDSYSHPHRTGGGKCGKPKGR